MAFSTVVLKANILRRLLHVPPLLSHAAACAAASHHTMPQKGLQLPLCKEEMFAALIVAACDCCYSNSVT